MKITVSELYGRCEELASIFGLSVNEDNRFVFDLHDDTSLESIKNAFGGIEKVLKPANGRYMVLMVLNEKPTNLMAVFPETEDGDMKAELFDVVDKKSLDIFKGVNSKDYDMITIENFSDVLDDEAEKERVETKINDFMFADEKKEDEDEPKDEVKDDEDKSEDDVEDKSEDKAEVEDEEIDVIDGEEPGDGGLAGASLADDEDVDFTVVDDEDETDEVVAESTVTEAEGDAPAAPAQTAAPEETGEEPAATIEDPTKNIRDLIKYYTDRLNSAANSETTSTDTVSALQDVIASLVNNLETISELKDVETEEAKAAAKNAEKNEEPVSEDGVPSEACAGPDCPPKLQMDTETVVGDLIDSPHAASMQASVTDLSVAPDAAAPELTTPFSDDLGADSPAPTGDLDVIGPDGLPAGGDVPSDKFIDDQIAQLGPASDETVSTFADGAASDSSVYFAPGQNAVNWSDHLYDRGQANYIDNDTTVPAVLQELKEYAAKARAAVEGCGGVNETTIGRLNKFCNLCATAYDTWHKLQDSINGSYELCEAFGCHEGRGIDARNAESVQPLMESVDREQEKLNMAELKDSAAEFNAVQEYLKSITKFL